MAQSESVQYFQFNNEGNMYIFEPGAGFTGECKWVDVGFEWDGDMSTMFSLCTSVSDGLSNFTQTLDNSNDSQITSGCDGFMTERNRYLYVSFHRISKSLNAYFL